VNRVNVTDAGGTRTGHFDYGKIQGRWSDGDRNGYGNGSGGTGRGQAIIFTSGGAWVRERWTQWSGEKDQYSYISDQAAQEWLLSNGFDGAVAEHFGPVAEEEDRRPGRPAIGGAVHVRLGDLLTGVDSFAAEFDTEHKMSRADAVRELVKAGLIYYKR
jgi:hypothetical protein